MQTAHLDPTAELSACKSSSRHKRQQLGSVSGSVCSERSAPLWERREEGVGQSAGGRFGVGARLVLGAELEVQATVGRVPHLCSHKHPRTQSPLRTHTHTHIQIDSFVLTHLNGLFLVTDSQYTLLHWEKICMSAKSLSTLESFLAAIITSFNTKYA